MPRDIDPEGSATGSHPLDGDHSQGWQTLPNQQSPHSAGERSRYLSHTDNISGKRRRNQPSQPYFGTIFVKLREICVYLKRGNILNN